MTEKAITPYVIFIIGPAIPYKKYQTFLRIVFDRDLFSSFHVKYMKKEPEDNLQYAEITWRKGTRSTL